MSCFVFLISFDVLKIFSCISLSFFIYFKILYQAFHPLWFLWNLLLKRDILLDTVHLCSDTEVSASRGADHYSFQRSSKRFSPDNVSDVSVRSARYLALFPIGHCTVACLQLSWLWITTALYMPCKSHRLPWVIQVEAAISS